MDGLEYYVDCRVYVYFSRVAAYQIIEVCSHPFFERCKDTCIVVVLRGFDSFVGWFDHFFPQIIIDIIQIVMGDNKPWPIIPNFRKTPNTGLNITLLKLM